MRVYSRNQLGPYVCNLVNIHIRLLRNRIVPMGHDRGSACVRQDTIYRRCRDRLPLLCSAGVKIDPCNSPKIGVLSDACNQARTFMDKGLPFTQNASHVFHLLRVRKLHDCRRVVSSRFRYPVLVHGLTKTLCCIQSRCCHANGDGAQESAKRAKPHRLRRGLSSGSLMCDYQVDSTKARKSKCRAHCSNDTEHVRLYFC